MRRKTSAGGPAVVAGVDEVGRGCIAGPVITAAVILNPGRKAIAGLDDSKRLSPRRREQLALIIQQQAVAWSIGRAEASEVDRLNVLQASLLAMRRALLALAVAPDWVRVDGAHFPGGGWAGEAVVRGDRRFPDIMAASILAKVVRDCEMALLDDLYPGYHFQSNKGYPTADHLQQLNVRGACVAHRLSFGPVRRRGAEQVGADTNGLSV